MDEGTDDNHDLLGRLADRKAVGAAPVEAILARGRRRRRGRRATASGLAVVALVGIGTAAVRGSSDGDNDLVAATDAEPALPVPSTNPGVPPTPTAPPTTPATPTPTTPAPTTAVPTTEPPPPSDTTTTSTTAPSIEPPELVVALDGFDANAVPATTSSARLLGDRGVNGGCVWAEVMPADGSPPFIENVLFPIGYSARFTAGTDESFDVLDHNGSVVTQSGAIVQLHPGLEHVYDDLPAVRCRVVDSPVGYFSSDTFDAQPIPG